MDCAFREVREALMPLHTCDVVASDRFSVHRECATNLHSTRLYLPSDFWRGFEAGAAYSGGTASGIVEK